MAGVEFVKTAAGAVAALEVLGREKLLALDTETTGLHIYEGARPRLLQLAAESSPIYVLDLWAIGEEGVGAVRRFFEPVAGREFIIHNAAFDIPMLWAADLLPRGGRIHKSEDYICDTMIASQLLLAGHPVNRQKGTHSLAGVAKRVLGLELDKGLQASDWSAEVLDPAQVAYAAKDVEVLFPLHSALKTELKKAGMLPVFRVECMAAIAFGLMSGTGIPADMEALNALRETKLAEVEKAREILVEWLRENGYEVAPSWNPRSTVQMMEAFRATSTPIPIDRLKKTPTIDQKYLAELRPEHTLIDLYLRYKESATRVSNVETLLKHRNDKTGRIHSSYRQLGADSGRTSSNSPNVQQIPRSSDFRGCFKAGAGYKFIVCDYSQIELRLAAAVANETRMLQAYRDEEDIHKITGSLISGKPLDQIDKETRSRAKCLNFALLYGCGSRALREQAIASYGVQMTLGEADAYRKLFFESYKALKRWHDRLDDAIHTTQQKRKEMMVALHTPFGRRRWVLSRDDRKTIRANTPIQGLGADIIKMAMVLLAPSLIEREVELVAMVHDELVLRVEESKAEVWASKLSQIMERAGDMVLQRCQNLAEVPIVAEAGICDSWAEK